MRRILASEIGIDTFFLKGDLTTSGFCPSESHGRVQWGETTMGGLAVFPLAFEDNQCVVIGIRHDGTLEAPMEKASTAADFESAVAWIAMEK